MNTLRKNQAGVAQKIGNRLGAILIVGAPGSGKGTQGRALGALPRFVHCSCGDVFRSIDPKTKLGQEFLEYFQAGRLMPDSMTIDIWREHMARTITCGGFNPANDCLVLDGIPRNLSQAQLIDELIEVRLVFNLRCPIGSVLIDRMRRRARKENRPDDADESVIEHRLDVYECDSKPLLNYYPATIVHPIDATQPPHLVLKSILDVIAGSESSSKLRGRVTEIQLQAVASG